MLRMGSADKKTRKKRTRKISKPLSSPSSGSVQTAQSSLPPFLPELAPQKPEEEIEEIQRKMDADIESNSQLPPVAKSSNPYLGGSCLFCHCKRTESTTAETDNVLESNQLQLWVCNNCRKTVDEEDKRNATMASLLISMEEDLKLEPPSIPPLEPMTSPSNSPTSSSEPTTPNGSVCNCEACTERRMIEREQEKENSELKEVWGELGHAVRYVYREAGTGMSQNTESMPDSEKMKEHVHRLCMRDPHHLFQQLECLGRDYVIEMKVRLLKQLTAGHKTPPQAKQFVAMLLEEYKNLCTAASTLASYLTELMEHLKRFNLTWELHNKHLFQSIIYTDPVVQNSLPMLMTQLRLGAASKEAYHEDTYPNILHRYLKFDDEMSVISVVWRECEQLLENYNDEQTAIKAKQKMMKEDLDFFMAQRKLLQDNVLKNMPNSSKSAASLVSSSHTKHGDTHSLEAQFSERMRNILQGTRSSEEQSLCPNCNRKVCPCDECSINHTVFCGIINPEVADQMPIHSSSSYPHDQSRYIIDVKAPSMSSISSSSGSNSPITVHPERLAFPFDDNFQLDDEADEIQEDIDDKISDSPDSEEDDDETSTDEFEEEEGGGARSPVSNPPVAPSNINDGPGERQQGDGQENLLVSSVFVPGSNTSEGNSQQESPCDCTHCAQASILQNTSSTEDTSLVSVSQSCQCHACMMQTSGQSMTTSLPQHLPSAPRPAALHLYPHIHGSNALHPGMQQDQIRHSMQSGLSPHVYKLHGMHHASPTSHKSFTNIHNSNNKAQQQTNTGFNFDLNSHELYNALDWESTPFDTTKLSMYGLGQKYTNNVTSELLNAPPPPLMTRNPFLKELGGVDNSLANLMKTSTVLQHCVSAAKPLTSTTVTTSTGITTSIQGLSEASTSVQSAFSDTQNKIFKVSKALLNQQQQNKPKVSTQSNHLTPTTAQHLQTSSHTNNTNTTTATSSTFTFGLPSPLNKNLGSPLGGLFTGNSSPPSASSSCSTSPASSLSSNHSSSPPSSTPPSFSLSNALTSPPTEFCFKQTSPSSHQHNPVSFSPTSSPQSSPQSVSSTTTVTTTTSHQLKLNPDFIRAAAALQKNISEQNAARQQQQHSINGGLGMNTSGLGGHSLHNYQAFSNLNLQNFTTGLPPQQQGSLLTCTHQFSAAINNPIMQLAGANSPALSMPTPNTTPVGLATSGLKLTNNQFLPSHNHHHNNTHMTLPTQPVSSSVASSNGGSSQQPTQTGMIAPPQGSNNHINNPITPNNNSSAQTNACTDPDCDTHHDNDNESIDDSCSEQSSSTSTSNQKDGKYCDCCYCEFFGHTTPPTVPISKNYPEMRERLRKRLKIKNEKKNGGPVNVNPDCPIAGKLVEKLKKEEEQTLKIEEPPEPILDPLHQKGLDELVRFINGSTLEEHKKSSKAAKRARQKQRKAEEKAAKEAEILAKQAAEEALHKQQLLQNRVKQQKTVEVTVKKDPPNSAGGEDQAEGKKIKSEPKVSTVAVNGTKKAKQKAEKDAQACRDVPKQQAVDSSSGHQSQKKVGGGSSLNQNDKCNTSEKVETHKKVEASRGNTESGGAKENNLHGSRPQVSSKETNIEQKVHHVMNQVLSNQHLQKERHTSNKSSPTSQQNQKNELMSSSTNNKTNQQITLNGDINMNTTNKGSGKTGSKKGKGGGNTANSGTTPQNSPRPGSGHSEGIKPGKNSLPQQQNSMVHQNNKPMAVSNGKQPTPPSQQVSKVNMQLADTIKQAAHKVILQGHQQHVNHNTNSQLPQQVVNAVLNKAAGKGISSQMVNTPPLPPAPPIRQSPTQNMNQQNHYLQHQPSPVQKNANLSPRPGVPLNRPILHAQRTLKDGKKSQQQTSVTVNVSQSAIPTSAQNGSCAVINIVNGGITSGSSLITPAVRSMISSSAPSTPDQSRHHGSSHQDIPPSAQTAMQLNFQQRSVPNTPTKQPPAATANQHSNSMATAQGKSRSEGQLHWASKKGEEQGSTGGRNKKKGRRNKVGEESTSVDEIFLPKEDQEHSEMDEFERELEEFKRFCLDSKPPPRREKLQVNVNLKDIFAKKKSGLGCA